METITVGCKLPHGLVIDLGSPSKAVTLKGADRVTGEAGLTENVDKVAFEAWLKSHDQLEFVKKGLLFASANKANLASQSKDAGLVKTGLEPIDPKAPPKGIAPLTKN